MHKIILVVTILTTILIPPVSTSLAAWQLNLEISTPDTNADTGIASNKLVIGTDPNATDEYDNQFDTIALLDGPVQAFFNHPEYEPGHQKLWRDFRKDSLPKEWEIEVQSEVNKPVNITWQINTADPLKLTLIDKSNNQEIAMRSSAKYSYSNGASMPKIFLLKVDEEINTIPSTGSQSSGGGSKGGGCGYIKNIGKGKKMDINEYGQNTLNMLILITPLLIPMLFHKRRMSSAFMKRNNHLNDLK